MIFVDKYMLRRYLLFFVALVCNAFGIALITKAGLGTSSVTSFFYVLSLFTPLSLGQWTIIGNIIFIIAEYFMLTRAELRDDLRVFLLQIPITLCFGVSIDLSLLALRFYTPTSYPEYFLGLLLGCFILAFGTSLEVKANVALVAGEYIVRTIAHRLGTDFGYTKLAFDCSLLLAALVTSFYVFSGVRGVREGTLISAFIVGPLVHWLYPHLMFLNKHLDM